MNNPIFSQQYLASEERGMVRITLLIHFKNLIMKRDISKLKEFVEKNKRFIFSFKNFNEELIEKLYEEMESNKNNPECFSCKKKNKNKK